MTDGAAPLAPRGRRPPECTMSDSERQRVVLAHELWALRAHLIAQPPTPQVVEHLGALERAVNLLVPPDGDRYKAPRRSAAARREASR